MAMDPPLLEARGLCLQVPEGSRLLVDHADLILRPGEMTGLIGPNGSGKTSLLRMLAGWTRPSGGSALLAGKPVHLWPGRKRADLISYCPQEIPSDLPFTVEEILHLGMPVPGKGLPVPRQGQDARDIMGYVGITELADHPFPTLSGGEKQLVLFARAMMQDGAAFLLDEPGASMDMGTAHRLFSMLAELAREGKTLLAAVHDLHAAAAWCDRLILMDKGRIIADGSPAEVLDPETLGRVYGLPLIRNHSLATGAILLEPRPSSLGKSGSPRVHLVGGGGSAVGLTRRLFRMGIPVTAGVAHTMDSDCLLWEHLGIPHITVPAFSPVGKDAVAGARTMAADAQVVVLTEFPLGPGNRGNLELLGYLQEEGKRIVVLDDSGGGKRSFHDGVAESLFRDIIACTGTASTGDLMDLLADMAEGVGS